MGHSLRPPMSTRHFTCSTAPTMEESRTALRPAFAHSWVPFAGFTLVDPLLAKCCVVEAATIPPLGHYFAGLATAIAANTGMTAGWVTVIVAIVVVAVVGGEGFESFWD